MSAIPSGSSVVTTAFLIPVLKFASVGRWNPKTILRQFQAEPAVRPHFLQTSRYDQLGGMI